MLTRLTRLFTHTTALERESPILIGGTGGSGTRVVQTLLEQSGVFMGRNLNEHKDAMDFEPVLNAHINPILEHTHSLNYRPETLPESLRAGTLEAIRAFASPYRREAPRAAPRWGWKNPRSMYLLPMIQAVFPCLQFIHVVRDGRDMAFSVNQWQVERHYRAFFDVAQPPALPEASIALWARANVDIATWAAEALPNRYLRVRFEDICEHPLTAIKKISGFLSLPMDGPRLQKQVQRPETSGRWKAQSGADIARLQRTAETALKYFDYLN